MNVNGVMLIEPAQPLRAAHEGHQHWQARRSSLQRHALCGSVLSQVAAALVGSFAGAGRAAERDSCEQAEFAYANGRLKGVERMVVRVDEPLGEPWSK